MQSSSVVLPAPEAPKTMVKPAGAEKSTSRMNSVVLCVLFRKCAFSAGVYGTASLAGRGIASAIVPAG